jgi:alcohol-forming fatty acyl-CoA reductase
VPTNFDADEIVSKTHREMIENEVEVVFNALASIHLAEPIPKSAVTNMVYTQKVVDIVKQIRNLKSFVHVSTLYVNGYQDVSDEVIYDLSLSYKDVLSLAQVLKDDKKASQPLRVGLDHDFPYNYSVTKHFAEKLVVDQVSHLPTMIFRLPMIVPSYRYLPGWTDNMNHCSGLLVAQSKGFVHVWLGKNENPAHIVPVDFCANALAVSAWDVSMKARENFSVPIINYISKTNNISVEQHLKYNEEFSETPFEGSVYYISNLITESRVSFEIIFFLLSTLPAFVADGFCRFMGKKAQYMRLSEKIKLFLLILSQVALRRYKFENRNAKSLIENFRNSESYREELDFDFENFDWREMHRIWKVGLKKYYFKEDMTKCKELSESYRR